MHISPFIYESKISEGGADYVEDGREIFDDEEMDEQEENRKRNDKSNKKETKKRLRDVNKSTEGNASIRSMFGNVVSMKKEPKIKLDEDDILADILGEINPNDSKTNGSASSTAEASAKANTSASVSKIKEKTEMALVKDYIASFSKAVPRKPVIKSEADDEVNFVYIVAEFFDFFFKLLKLYCEFHRKCWNDY